MSKVNIYKLSAVLGLALILCLGGCDNPANEDTHGKDTAAAPAREAADTFYTAHLGILEKPEDMLTLDDEEPVALALEAYRGLKADVRALLAPEKAHLDVLKAGIDRLKAWAEHGVYYAAADMAAYLTGQPENTPAEPYPVAYSGSETMISLYKALAAAGRYTSLDLSDSRVGGISAGNEEGRAFIVSLVLPDSLAEIPKGTSATTTIFQGFVNLKTLSAAGVTRLGGYTFTALPSLAGVSLPKLTDITGFYAFEDCASLATVSLPEVVFIDQFTFHGCAGLASINLPKAETIEYGAFGDCTSLVSISLPKAKTLGNDAFGGCSSLAAIGGTSGNDLSEVVSTGTWAFDGCTSLTTVILPKAASIGAQTFLGCTSLATVNLPKVETILYSAFEGCTALTTVTLGTMPPTIGNRIFQQAAATPGTTITIKAPQLTLYTAITPWSDKVDMLNSAASYFWDNIAATKDNLTVNLAVQ